MSRKLFSRKYPARGVAAALGKILVLFGAFWLCIANMGAPCLEISEPKATGPVGIRIAKKDMKYSDTSEIAFELSTPVSSFTLKQGPDVLFEAACREGAGGCMPKKFRVTCTRMTDAASGNVLATTEVPAVASKADASGPDEADAVDIAAEKADEKKVVMNEAASKRCTEVGFLSSDEGMTAAAKTAEGKEGSLHFQGRMVPAPGYFSCNRDYKKCGQSYK
jgi:hypothetical protein